MLAAQLSGSEIYVCPRGGECRDAGITISLSASFLPTNASELFQMQDKQTKLWHSTYYDKELSLMQLYVKICRNLPSYGCSLFSVEVVESRKCPTLFKVRSHA